MPKPKREPIEGGLLEVDRPIFMQALRLSERDKLQQNDNPLMVGVNTLAMMVIYEDGTPVWSPDEWDQFGGNDFGAFDDLLMRAYQMVNLKKREDRDEKKPLTETSSISGSSSAETSDVPSES